MKETTEVIPYGVHVFFTPEGQAPIDLGVPESFSITRKVDDDDPRADTHEVVE